MISRGRIVRCAKRMKASATLIVVVMNDTNYMNVCAGVVTIKRNAQKTHRKIFTLVHLWMLWYIIDHITKKKQQLKGKHKG